MKINVHGQKYVCDHQGKPIKRPYYSFWVDVFSGPQMMSVSGWKYFPDTQTISSPSVYKGDGKFFNTTKLTKEMFNRVAQVAAAHFADNPDQEITQEEEEVTA